MYMYVYSHTHTHTHTHNTCIQKRNMRLSEFNCIRSGDRYNFEVSTLQNLSPPCLEMLPAISPMEIIESATAILEYIHVH